jgi:hypothetical protein
MQTQFIGLGWCVRRRLSSYLSKIVHKMLLLSQVLMDFHSGLFWVVEAMAQTGSMVAKPGVMAQTGSVGPKQKLWP